MHTEGLDVLEVRFMRAETNGERSGRRVARRRDAVLHGIGNRGAGERRFIEDSGPIYTLRDDLTVVQLVQTGDPPVYPESDDDITVDYYPAFGPAGIIVAGGDGNTYVGVPFAR